MKDIPFTGMAMHRRWAGANMPPPSAFLLPPTRASPGSPTRRNRGEAVELLVKVGRSSKEDAEASYDYLRRIDFFEPSSKVSRTKLRNLVAMEQRAGTVAAGFDIDRLAMPGLTELTD